MLFKLLLNGHSSLTVKIFFCMCVNAVFYLNETCERRVKLNVICEEAFA